MSDATTVDAAIAEALEAYDALTALGEAIEDEWTYVSDLSTSWHAGLDEVAAARTGEPLPALTGAAISAAIDEIAAIDDPHRAIDWLSTFPQVILLALGEPA